MRITHVPASGEIVETVENHLMETTGFYIAYKEIMEREKKIVPIEKPSENGVGVSATE